MRHICHPRFQAGALLKPERTQKRGDRCSLSLQWKALRGPQLKLSLQLNRTELSDERTLGYTVDELFVKD
jgi:hypothetical protein